MFKLNEFFFRSSCFYHFCWFFFLLFLVPFIAKDQTSKSNTKNGKWLTFTGRNEMWIESKDRKTHEHEHELCMCRCWLSAKEWIIMGVTQWIQTTEWIERKKTTYTHNITWQWHNAWIKKYDAIDRHKSQRMICSLLCVCMMRVCMWYGLNLEAKTRNRERVTDLIWVEISVLLFSWLNMLSISSRCSDTTR